LKRIFGSKRDEIIEGWEKVHNMDIHNLYTSLNIIRMIKSRRMKRAGHWESQKKETSMKT
jgi:hypothetical protein